MSLNQLADHTDVPIDEPATNGVEHTTKTLTISTDVLEHTFKTTPKTTPKDALFDASFKMLASTM
ncbi:hypothetical protein [Agromyces seonyuensis]|uniref:Uncharacterized protein n=1 Tax=Agromyces seonyuensis TaxID=2662446 RepID=A0A6I4P5M9_9MICO|nr:hypothetical protein [Agromyces seonyuensis]MWC00376.1 hypothetical protein [Agromyces seonyuensis]